VGVVGLVDAERFDEEDPGVEGVKIPEIK